MTPTPPPRTSGVRAASRALLVLVLGSSPLACGSRTGLDFGASGAVDAGHEASLPRVDAGPPRFKDVSAGNDLACDLSPVGAVQCWGWDVYGALGNGRFTNNDFLNAGPFLVGAFTSGVSAITAGDNFGCALESGAVSCWGYNATGQLGDGTTDDSDVPVRVRGLPAGIKGVAAGGKSACAITSTDSVECWGDNEFGQLGNGSTVANSVVPVAVTGLSASVTGISVGVNSACVVTSDGGVECWGGQRAVVDATTGVAVPVTGFSDAVVAVSVGFGFTCATVASGGVECFGANAYGQLGDGTTANRASPVAVVGLPARVKQVGASRFSADGHGSACALLVTGAVLCWGYNGEGELGNGGATGTSPTPTPVSGITDASALSVGGDFACAVTSAGAECWGSGSFGTLGTGRNSGSLTPVVIDALP